MDEKQDKTERAPAASGRGLPKEGETQDPDTEGHTFLPDSFANQQISRGRGIDIERGVREAQRRKEVKPDRSRRG